MTDSNLPTDPDDLDRVPFELPRLDPDSPTSCPVPMPDILEYLAAEAYPEQVAESELSFVRTASVEGSAYWIWEFTESTGAECYVTVSSEPNGSTTTGYDENYDGLTPEQYMLGVARGWL